MSFNVGAVVIGRNEGERLVRCLKSVGESVQHIVYVDSGSSDDSLHVAEALGASVVSLEDTSPFTAARARNAGYAYLAAKHKELELLFFVDGDCEVCPGWVTKASLFMESHPEVALAWGQRFERYPDRSIYNLLCDMEWRSSPIGETRVCGGDALIRITALSQVGGYRDSLICGEEPELCVRLRQKGWRIWHLEERMTLHDAAIYRFAQWWRRMMRGGYAFAEGAFLHGKPPERHWVRESRRVWIWGLCLPTAIVFLFFIIGARASLLLVLYPIQIARLALRHGFFSRTGWVWATAMVIGKFPEMLGQLKFVVNRLRNTRSALIEYK
jgi:glycosyltransferase involved in cell wall biosynthesis